MDEKRLCSNCGNRCCKDVIPQCRDIYRKECLNEGRKFWLPIAEKKECKINDFDMARLAIVASAIAQTAKTARDLNRRLSAMLDSIGIDESDPEFEAAYGYLEGDCDEKPLIEYVKEQMQCKG